MTFTLCFLLSWVELTPFGHAMDVDGLRAVEVPNDWHAFECVFHNTKRTKTILEKIRELSLNPRKATAEFGPDGPHTPLYDVQRKKEGCRMAIGEFNCASVDKSGNIIGLTLEGLRDEDIADLSKLPSNLRTLQINHCEITALDLTQIPSGLISLDLSNNKLGKVNLNGLPIGLECLRLDGNNLSELELKNIPQTIRSLSMSGNQLDRIDLSPLGLMRNAVNVNVKRNPGLEIVVNQRMVQEDRMGSWAYFPAFNHPPDIIYICKDEYQSIITV